MRSRKFRSVTGAQIALYLPNRGVPVYVPAAEPFYETSDPSEQYALLACPEAAEVVEERKPEPEPGPVVEHKAVPAPSPAKPKPYAKGGKRR